MSITELRHAPTQSRALTTLDKITDAGRAVLAEHGRDRLTTAQVADRAGVSIGTFYRYFEDRVALLDEIWHDRDTVTVEIKPETLEWARQLANPDWSLSVPTEAKLVLLNLVSAIETAQRVGVQPPAGDGA